MSSNRLKRPSHEELKGLLLEGNFNSTSDDDALPASDPVAPVPIVLKLNEVKGYDRNPRRELNPVFDDIKASIREQRGLNNPFNVTRRPGESHYMVQSGGNTRLAILNELYHETEDEAFNTLHCLYVPWQSESSVICAHLIENELRGDMTLIDKAYAIRELKNQLETETNTTFSRSEFCKRAKTQGYTISRRHLIRFEYALELDQLIPNVLRNGLGANRIDTIKTTEKAYREFSQDKTDQFAPLFAHIMSTHDGEAWDFESVRRELDQRLASHLGMSTRRLRLEIDAITIKPITGSAPADIDSNTEETVFDQTEIEHSEKGTVFNERLLIETRASDLSDEMTLGRARPNPHTPSPNANIERNEKEIRNSAKEIIALDGFINPDLNSSTHLPHNANLKTLYSRSYILAQRIAKTIQMEHLVLPVKHGLGFIMEKPDQSFTAHDTWGLWWLLIGISEQSVSEERMQLCQQTALYQLYASDEPEHIQQLVGPAPTLALYPHEVLQNIDLINDSVFADIFRLMETCRHIRHHFSSTQLWSSHLI